MNIQLTDTPSNAAGDPAALRAEIRSELNRLEHLARLMESQFRIPGTRVRFGLDGLLGLVPVVGDGAAALPAFYLIMRAHDMGAPLHLKARMVGNVAVDLVIGAVPLVGDLADVGFKANTRNVRLLRQHFGVPSAEHEA